MTKDQFQKELFEFQLELGSRETESFSDDSDYEYQILPVKYIRKVKFKKLGAYLLVFNVQPNPAINFDVHFHSKLLYGLHPSDTPEKNWMKFGSKSHDYAQRWNRTVYDFLKDSITNRYEKEILLLEKFFDEYLIKPSDYECLIETSKKSINHKTVGGRPKGITKRTVDRYKKVFHHFQILKKKFPNKTKTELYELLATRDYDAKSYTRNTIRNIIEDKKYNLISSQ